MGSGFKDFAAGDILTANDVDGYLMRQTVMTFADASARDSALSGVLDEGMVAYLENSDAMTYYDGSAWKDVVRSVSGLVLVKTHSIAAGTGTVTITDAFSATYDNYRIHINGSLAAPSQIGMRMGTAATNYKWALIYSAYTGTVTQLLGSGSTQWTYPGVGSADFISFDVSVMNPNRAQYTTVGSPWASTSEAGHFSGVHETATAYTSFTLLPGGTTFNASTVRIYGYNNG